MTIFKLFKIASLIPDLPGFGNSHLLTAIYFCFAGFKAKDGALVDLFVWTICISALQPQLYF